MTWGEFKKAVEERDVNDDTKVMYIDWSEPWSDKEPVRVEWNEQGHKQGHNRYVEIY